MRRSSTPKSELDARAAFGNPQRSLTVHLKKQQEEQYNEESRVHSTLAKRSFVFSGLHGCGVAATLLAVLRVAAGSGYCKDERMRQVLTKIMIAVSFPSTLSLGYLVWSSFACDRLFEQRERARERWEMDNFPEGEFAEMVGIYRTQGLSEPDAEQVVKIFSKNKEAFLNLMMVEELGYSRFQIPSSRDTFLCGTLPSVVSHAISLIAPLTPLLMPAPVVKGETVLGTQVVVLSVLQTMLLYGAYADVANTLPVIAGNCAWLSVLYGATTWVARHLLPQA